VRLEPLPRRFYERDPVRVARDLIGRLLVREMDGERLVGRIVEAEAYARDDAASHAFRGKTRRNRSMFGPPGHAYVYRSHGIHRCLNAVTLPGSAVLLRALEPIEGVEAMARRRGLDDRRILCAGPGRLCQALAIDLDDDGVDLCTRHHLWIAGGEARRNVVVTRRVGISVAVDLPWRFVEADSRYTSRSVGWGRLPGGPVRTSASVSVSAARRGRWQR
jgi:DNA-3-methyladenine glycosylase